MAKNKTNKDQAKPKAEAKSSEAKSKTPAPEYVVMLTEPRGEIIELRRKDKQ